MKVEIIAKQGKNPKNHKDLVRELTDLEGVTGAGYKLSDIDEKNEGDENFEPFLPESSGINKGEVGYTIFGWFNPSVIDNIIISNGYSILKSKINAKWDEDKYNSPAYPN